MRCKYSLLIVGEGIDVAKHAASREPLNVAQLTCTLLSTE